MANLPTVFVIAALFSVTPAFGKPPPGRGRACDAHSKCAVGLQCVTRADGKSTCEVICTANTKCPDEQRCVKDGAQMVCTPIVLGLPGL